VTVRVRRTQEERSASTRARLLEATLDSLVDRGYARTTTVEVAERAGVSRGAQLHHYPTKAELVIAAVEHLFEVRDREFREAMARLPAGADRGAAAIQHLWSIVSGRTFYAWLELTVAARTDPDLRQRMSELSRRTGENVEHTFKDVFPAPAAPGPFHAAAPHFAIALMQGLALDQVVAPDESMVERMLEILRLLSVLALPPSPRGGP
jgi:AcrR family transcriptional regulator